MFDPLTASHIEKRSFALFLYPRLVCGGYDIVHYNELTMGSALFHMRRLLGGKYRLLYCNGAPSPPVHYYNRCDFVQLLTEPDYNSAIEFGFDRQRIFMLPYGVDDGRFNPSTKLKREMIRAQLKIPLDVRVVLSLAAIKSEHKRIDYLIEETAAVNKDLWLVVAGQRTNDTPRLEELAQKLMPNRWCFLTIDHDQVPDLCGAADLFCLTSLTEAFGLVTIEALLSELPTVVHNGPVFNWLIRGTKARAIDMSRRGALRDAIKAVLADISEDSYQTVLAKSRKAAGDRFGWSRLTSRYVEMYEKIIRTEKL
jgi:glycosyltransferase involved in cell wall biosynthesis